MFRKISENMLDTYMGNSQREKKISNRVGCWLVGFFYMGLIVGMLLFLFLK